MSTSFRLALPAEADALTCLLRASKAYWQYTPEQMAAWESELCITVEEIAKWTCVRVLEDIVGLIGFYALKHSDEGQVALEHFWIAPEYIQQGFGKRMWGDLVSYCQTYAIVEFLIESDPYAEGFYMKMGAVRIGEKQSAASKRLLPLLRFLVPPV